MTEPETNNPLVWRPISNANLGILNSISNLVADLEIRCFRMLTSVRTGPQLVMVSDYSGQHAKCEAEIYSFLLADAAYLWLWLEKRKSFRKKYLPDLRRMSYKTLNDKQRQLALIPFLRIAHCIPGLLFTVIVDKRIHRLFGIGYSDILGSKLVRQKWKPNSVEKLLRIAALGGLLIACMSAPSQDLLWISDEDDIVPDIPRLYDATEIVHLCTANILSHCLGHLRFGTTRCDDGSRSLEDLASLPDLVSGTFAELSPLLLGASTMDRSVFRAKDCPQKVAVISNWIADRSDHTLEKICVIIKKDREKVRKKCINFGAMVCRPEFMWHEEARAILEATHLDQK